VTELVLLSRLVSMYLLSFCEDDSFPFLLFSVCSMVGGGERVGKVSSGW
jgi:hypothetical protein